VIEHLPPHLVYVEPFGGAGSVLLQKPRSDREVYNDMDGELVNLFQILRSPLVDELVRLVRLTPYALREFRDAFQPTQDALERARRLLVRSHMGHGTRGTGLTGSMGFRRDGMKGRTDTAGNWAGLDEELLSIAARFRGVTIEERPAIELVAEFDDPDAVLYLDPPYLPQTRSGKKKLGEGYHTYGHEMSVDDHKALLDRVQRSRASILLSGYSTKLYDDALAGWVRKTVEARSHCNAPRIEVLWINPIAAAGLAQQDLFDRRAA
jgi:DNA adenine methylase